MRESRQDRRRRRRRQRRKTAATALLLLALAVTAIILASSAKPSGFSDSSSQADHDLSEAAALSSIITESAGGGATGKPRISQGTDKTMQTAESLYSQSAIVVDMKGGGAALFELMADEQIYPASLTKMMTAVVALEMAEDSEDKIILGQNIFDEIVPLDLTTAGLVAGESLSQYDLLYGLLLESGAECALGLAIGLTGSETEFVRLMNQKADALGMESTHFTNVTGRHDEKHVSTARDMSILLEYAVRNPMFYEIFTSRTHMVSATNMHPDGVTFRSTLFSRTDVSFEEKIHGFRLLGGKTGYTYEAGQCLASLWELDGERLIIVTAGAKVENNAYENRHIEDAVWLLENL